ncbi:threonine dehydratase biosynthetic, chloroplastic [Tanacetum coccineum]
MFEEKRSIQLAGALALAGAEAYCRFYNLKDENVVAVTSGPNMNFDRLRLVRELANIGRQQEAVLTTFMLHCWCWGGWKESAKATVIASALLTGFAIYKCTCANTKRHQDTEPKMVMEGRH